MKEQKLVSIIARIEELEKQLRSNEITFIEFANKVIEYKNFLKQPLTLGMFVPCDEEGKVLEEPFGYMKWLTVQGGVGGKGSFSSEFLQYQQAQSRVLFEGFETIADMFEVFEEKDIEYLANKGYDLTLTPTACKQIGWE